MTRVSDATRDALSERVRGPVFAPGTGSYDEERTGFQRFAPHRPSVVVRVADEQDVRAVVEFAAARGERVAVQGSGHGLGAALDGGILISTRGMTGIRVDPASRTAWVEAGTTWRQVIEAAAPHGLAPLSGSSPGVSAVSYTLSGGIGLLARKYGYSADHVRRFDLVTADGTAHQVTADDEPDLFWALRGGAGNFGVVTGMEVGLVPVRQLFGGGLYFDLERHPGVLDGWWRWTSSVPEEMTSAVSVLPFPDLPVVPEVLRGRYVAQFQLAYLGSSQEGKPVVEPLRALGTPLRDSLREVPFTESGSLFEEPDRPHAYRSSNRLLRDLDSGALATLPALTGPSLPVMCAVGMRHLGGALARPPRNAGAVGGRAARYSLNLVSPLEPGQEDTVRGLHRAALEPWSALAVGRSLNFSYGPLGYDEVRAAFAPRDYQRLTELKSRCDPDGLFLVNHPIPARAEGQ